jgi:putative addiction module killer protein
MTSSGSIIEGRLDFQRSVVYKLHVLELKQTETFRKWRQRLKDQQARAMIASRLDRLAQGHAGDAEPVGEGISELRIHYGPVIASTFRNAEA